MSASPHAARNLDDALAQALQDLEGGLTPLQVLDRYPDYEAELGPLLETAYRLRTSRWPTLSMAARVAGRERIHAALQAEKAKRRFILAPFWRQLGAGAALVLLAGTTYFASPISPLRAPRPSLSTPVPAVLTVPLPPTIIPTWTLAASATAQPTATVLAVATPFVSPSGLIVSTAEPTEADDADSVLVGATEATASPSPLPSAPATRPPATRPPTATQDPTRAPSPMPSPSKTATQVTSGATSAPTVPTFTPTPEPSETPSNTPVKPSATPVPTETPEPTDSPTTRPPTATATRPKATNTPLPTPTPSPIFPFPTIEVTIDSPTPKPSRTPEPTHTAEPSHTPEPSSTPKPGDSPAFGSGRPLIIDLLRAGKVNPGQELRALIEETRRAERARSRPRRP